MTAADLLTVLWLIGIAAMAVWFLVTNLRWQKLRRTRAPYAAENCRYPVYLVEAGLPSPCLFGLFRPAIYLTPAVVTSPEQVRHVLAMRPPTPAIWTRCGRRFAGVCLAVYWFDPLVWIAAAVSKADGGAGLRRGRHPGPGRGRTHPLRQNVAVPDLPVRTGPGSPLLSATTMTADKRRPEGPDHPHRPGTTDPGSGFVLVLALAAGVCAVTFTGARRMGETGGVRSLTGDELAYFNEGVLQSGGYYSIRNQFLNSLYENSEDIDLFESLYCGTGIDAPMTDEESAAGGRL